VERRTDCLAAGVQRYQPLPFTATIAVWPAFSDRKQATFLLSLAPMSTPHQLDRLLVVAEPWASLLVDGEKAWELRSTSTKIRGPIGIAAKGTGTIIGAVDLVDVHGPFTSLEIAAYERLHRVPAWSTSTYSGPKGLYGWEVTGAVRFDTPVPYRHPRGAVIWVLLDPPVEGG
jgi:hypothetical protein